MHQHKRKPGQNTVHHIQQRRYKQKCELKRFGNTCQKRGQRRAEQKAARRFPFVFPCALVHCQRGAGKTEHHKWELTGHKPAGVHAEPRGVGRCKLRKKDVLRTGNVRPVNHHGAAESRLPERQIEHVMQAERN